MCHISNQDKWSKYIERYRNGEWRSPIFHDMILDDAVRFDECGTFLDIGCGRGFDDNTKLQKSLIESCGKYIGIEPDSDIRLIPELYEVHRCTFDEAPIEPSSIHIAFAVMVLEHIPDPEAFFSKLRKILVPGGIFWGFTVDSRHYFTTLSRMAERLRFKNLYLNLVHGKQGLGRYENYPTHYLANSPERIGKQAREFSKIDFVSFSRVGQLDFYFPEWLRPLAHTIDRKMIDSGKPGLTLAVRVEK